MKLMKGAVSIPMAIGLVLMAIAIPVAGQLTLKNQDIRNRAAGNHPPNCTCTNGKYTGSGCVALGYTCAIPSVVTDKKCTKDRDCNGGQLCSSGVCKNRCTSDSSCGSGQVCSSGGCVNKCTSDSSCGSGQVCSSGHCVYKCNPSSGTGTCPLVITPTTVLNRACTSTYDTCGVGYHCKSFKCIPNVLNGGVCVFDSDCASGSCIGNYPNRKCAEVENNRPIGASCLLSKSCSSGKCSFGKCVETTTSKLKLGSACSQSSQCSSAVCDSGKCRAFSPLNQCIDDRDCVSPLKCKNVPNDEVATKCM